MDLEETLAKIVELSHNWRHESRNDESHGSP